MSVEAVCIFLVGVVFIASFAFFLFYPSVTVPPRSPLPERRSESQQILDKLNASIAGLKLVYELNPRRVKGGLVKVKVEADLEHNRETLNQWEARVADALTKIEEAARELRETRARINGSKKTDQSASQESSA